MSAERVMARPATRVRLLTLSTLFPSAAQPRHGIFVANRLRRICDSGRASSVVVAAIPRFPGMYRTAAGAPPAERTYGFDVFHPRYAHLPLIGMRMQPDALAAAILGELRRRKLDASAFDVVDAHYFYPDGVAAARVADALGLPLVISARGSDINRIGEIEFARRRMLAAAQRASALIAVSGALARAMTAMGMPAARLHVLRNGVDVDVFAPVPRQDARARLRITHTGPLVVAIGNLVPEKGFDLLIEAVARMPAARLLIVGQGPLAGKLRAQAESVVPGRAEWRADMPQADLRFAYSAADVLALPSLREGWPNVVLESIACGTPVVAAEVGGVPEIIGGARAPAKIVAARDAEVWAQALDAMIARQLPVQKVREYARQFGWDEIVERQCALYEDAAGRWPARSQAQHPAKEDAHA